MIVSVLGLVSLLSQDSRASKKLKDILPLLLGKYKFISFYSPWGELPKNQAQGEPPALSSSEQKVMQGPPTGSKWTHRQPEAALTTHHFLHTSLVLPSSTTQEPFNFRDEEI